MKPSVVQSILRALDEEEDGEVLVGDFGFLQEDEATELLAGLTAPDGKATRCIARRR